MSTRFSTAPKPTTATLKVTTRTVSTRMRRAVCFKFCIFTEENEAGGPRAIFDSNDEAVDSKRLRRSWSKAVGSTVELKSGA